MIEAIVALCLTFGGGWYVGHENVSVSCLDEPLVAANCVDIQPPNDPSFGATTSSYVNLVGQYRKCKAACEATK